MNEENNTSPNIAYAPMDVYCIGCKNRKLVQDCMYNGDLKKIVTVWTCEHQEACNDVYKYCTQKIGEQLNIWNERVERGEHMNHIERKELIHHKALKLTEFIDNTFPREMTIHEIREALKEAINVIESEEFERSFYEQRD